MVYALLWLGVLSLLALWSLAAWAMHALAVWSLAQAGALSGAASGVGTLPVPGWMPPWVPLELVQAVSQWLATLGPWLDSLLQAAPSLAGGLTVAAWAVWGLGSLLLLLLGAGLNLFLSLRRRRA
ncbi:MAG: hypothetical protein RL722_1713 [Pseudomonadota bacterium]|jgi:hypothetical protein